MYCKICNQPVDEPGIEVKDFSVSKEKFQIKHCDHCLNYYTSNAPKEHEIGRYYESEEYVSHNDTKEGLIHKLYHAVRNYSLKQKLKLVGQIQTGKNILDYGCGTGAFLKACKDHNYNTLGIEPNPVAVATAAKKGIKCEEPNYLKEIETQSIDTITLWHVLEHIHKLDYTLEQFDRILTENGTLIIAVPNINSYDSKYYKRHWAALDVPRHLYHFTPNGIEKVLKNKGFRLTKTIGMKFDSFYVSMLSEKYLDKYPKPLQLARAFIVGLKSNLKAGKTNYSSNIYVFKKA